MAQPLQGAMWKQLLQHSARDNLTLQGQIREMLVSVILDGQLKPDAPVPSSRELATELLHRLGFETVKDLLEKSDLFTRTF